MFSPRAFALKHPTPIHEVCKQDDQTFIATEFVRGVDFEKIEMARSLAANRMCQILPYIR
jgi:hypothetical protein